MYDARYGKNYLMRWKAKGIEERNVLNDCKGRVDNADRSNDQSKSVTKRTHDAVKS
jgi:hypothetical protein